MSADGISIPGATLLVTGATGLVGKRLCKALESRGAKVRKLSRGQPNAAAGWFQWNPEAGTVDSAALAGLDGIVHLAGDNIADGRWTMAKKKRIRESRVQGTKLIAQAILAANPRPQAVISASAIGYYGNRGDELVHEDSQPGPGFLPEVCTAWESAIGPVEAAGIRTVRLRIGVVLSTQGGALAKMLFPFRMGGGGVVGSGRQYMSWITLDDLVSTIIFCLERGDVSGPVNAVAPQPVTNQVFTRALGKALHRPTLFPLPGFAARLMFGEMADDLLLGSTRVACQRLQHTGFPFAHAEIETALQQVIQANA